MISEIAVSHTSSCMVRGTLVLVLYYTYTYRDLGLRQLLFTELLPIFKLSIFSTGESRKPGSPNSTYVRCIIKNYRPLRTYVRAFIINNETVSTCNNNNNGYLIEDKDERSASAPPVRIYSRTVYLRRGER